MTDILQVTVELAAGSAIGLVLALTGAGGSILAVPVLLYAVGISDPLTALGTGACVVSASATVAAVQHARQSNVDWRIGSTFAIFSALAASVGARFGIAVGGARLISFFPLILIGAVTMTLCRERLVHEIGTNRAVAPRSGLKIAGAGGACGFLAGLFGIGGGFLAVPGLLWSSDLPMARVIGSSLVAVSASAAAAALSYSTEGHTDWRIALVTIVGALAGSFLGSILVRRLRGRESILKAIFSGLVMSVAGYMLIVGK